MLRWNKIFAVVEITDTSRILGKPLKSRYVDAITSAYDF